MAETQYIPDPMPDSFEGNVGGTSSFGTLAVVTEVDGSPSVANVSTIRFSNGSVTDDGSGQVTVSTGGGDVSGSGSPVGSVTPSFVNQFYRRTDSPELWQATGLTNADWVQWI